MKAGDLKRFFAGIDDDTEVEIIENKDHYKDRDQDLYAGRAYYQSTSGIFYQAVTECLNDQCFNSPKVFIEFMPKARNTI